LSLRREQWIAYFSILPAFVLLAVFKGYPILNTFYHSLTEWDGLNSTFIGFGNFISILTNGELLLLLRNNFIFLLSVPGILLLCLVVSVLLFEKTAGAGFFRSVYYLPTILSSVVIGFLVTTMFSSTGPVNVVMRALGLERFIVDWLNYVPTEFMILILCFYWQTLGQGTLIFLSAMSTISNEIFESATLDGATWGQRLFNIVIPLLYPAIFYFTVTNIIYVFIGLFGLVFAVTGGGPGYETTPLDYMIYLKAFKSGQFGYAAALSVVLFAIVMSITYMQLRISQRLND
jgi:multiple sugar transport system permease protein